MDGAGLASGRRDPDGVLNHLVPDVDRQDGRWPGFNPEDE
jgi:hypothetical protein